MRRRSKRRTARRRRWRSTQTASPSRDKLQGMRILLVEDEPSAARFIAKGLREAAYAVDVAGDGVTAAEQCQQNDYDAVILDVMLPGRDGLAVCRELRAGG